MNEIKQVLEQDCGDRKATRLESCKFSLLDINNRIDNINSQHYSLLNKLDDDFNDSSVSKELEPEVSTGLLRDIESIINEINIKVNILGSFTNKLEEII